MSKLLVKKTRQFSALTLLIGAVILLSFVFVQRSRSANPNAGTLSPTGPIAPFTGTWVGTAAGVPPSPDETTCVEGVNCDTFTLTLTGQPADWVGKKARIVISAADPALTDYDVFVHKGAGNAGPIAGSAASGGTPPEVVELDPSIPSVGTGVFSVHVVYFAATVADQYTGTVTAVGGAPTPTPTPSGTPTPTPPAAAGAPRFVNHYAPPGVLEDAGEPTMGVNWKTENNPRPPNATLFKNRNRITGDDNPPIPNGGTSLYYGGVNNIFLRATFDDCASPALVQWDQIPLTTANATRVFYDPILYTDHWTGRTFVCQELGLTPGGSTIEFTDNDGDTMFPSEGGAPSGGVDHQTIGGGPFHEPLPDGIVPTPGPNTIYPHAVYYASQNIGSATSQLSLDGGFSFPVQSALLTQADCVGLHGHLKVAEDGTAFVADKACQEAGVPLINDGFPAVLVSENNGATWDVRIVPNANSNAGVDDASVGVSWCPPGVCLPAEKADRSNHIYLGFMYDDGRPGIAYSNNKGQSWVRVVDIGALSGVKHIAFPTVSVGDPGRAVFAFFGTLTSGNYSEPAFPGIWHLYIATTYDFGVTWDVQNVSPEGPIQRGGICGSGTCRNLLDFFDSQIDKQGRILIAGQDGCIGGCELGGSNSFTAKAFITRQTGGRRMFSVYDAQTAEPTLPGAPALSGSFDGMKVVLTWPVPDSGGAPITQYKVYRASTATGPFLDPPLATVTQPGYMDLTPPVGDKFYVVTAVNAIGEGPFCKPFAPPSGPVDSPCVLPGILVSNDLLPNGADNDSGANTPIDPRVNVKFLHVAEPFIGGGAEQFFFTLQVAPSTMNSAPPSTQWFIIWQRQTPDAVHDRAYVAMKTVTGAPTFEYGKFGVPTAVGPNDPNTNTPSKVGDADAGSSYNPLTGVIRIVLSKSKLRALAFDGPSKYQPGSDLAATTPRVFFNRPDVGPRLQSQSSDFSGEGTYTIVGNASCALAPDLVRADSRKMHGAHGPFSIRLFPILPPFTSEVEHRNKGDNAHEVVLVFATPVTFTGATIGAAGGASTSPGPNSPPTSEVIVNLTGVANRQVINITLQGVSAGGAAADVIVPMTLLYGDVNGNSGVTNADVGDVKPQVGSAATADTFRADVNANGNVTNGDVGETKRNVGLTVP